MDKQKIPSNNQLLFKYAGLTMQILVSLAIAVWFGMKCDSWLSFSSPVLVWVLPLLVISAMIYQVIKDTSKQK